MGRMSAVYRNSALGRISLRFLFESSLVIFPYGPAQCLNASEYQLSGGVYSTITNVKSIYSALRDTVTF